MINKGILIISILCGFIILFTGIFLQSKAKIYTPLKESYKERYDVYSRCYDVTNDYQKALACIEIHKYLQGE
jgi:hypothetical protein